MRTTHELTSTENSQLKKWLFYPWLVFSASAFFYFFQFLFRSSTCLFNHQLAVHHAKDVMMLSDLAIFYYSIYVPMQIIAGLLLDSFHAGKVLVTASLILLIGLILMLVIGREWSIHIGQFLVILGSAFAFVGTMKVASIYFSRQRFALIAGLTTAIGMVGGIVGNLFITSLGEGNDGLTLGSFLMIVSLAITLILYLFSRDTAYTSNGNIAVGKQAFHGLFALLKKPQIWLNGIVGGLLYLPTIAFVQLWGISYLTQAHHFDKAGAIYSITFIFLGWAVGGTLIGWLSDKIKHRVFPLTAGAILAAIILTTIFYLPNLPDDSLDILLFAFGFCSGSQVIVFAISGELAPNQSVSTAIAVTNLLVMLGGILLVPLIMWLLRTYSEVTINHGIYTYQASDYQFSLLILPMGLIIAAFLTLFLDDPNYTHKANDF